VTPVFIANPPPQRREKRRHKIGQVRAASRTVTTAIGQSGPLLDTALAEQRLRDLDMARHFDKGVSCKGFVQQSSRLFTITRSGPTPPRKLFLDQWNSPFGSL
jgi:hypothetical protein